MAIPRFDSQPELRDENWLLRPLTMDDRDGLASAASDPAIWADHPQKDRWKPAVFAPYFDFLLESRTSLGLVDRATGRLAGCSRYYVAPDRPDVVSIGFTFLARAYWGGDANFAVKRLMLDHAFRSFPEVWFHIDPSNGRSQKATAKLGAEHIYDATLDLAGRPAPWQCFRLTRAAWEATKRRRDQPPSPTR